MMYYECYILKNFSFLDVMLIDVFQKLVDWEYFKFYRIPKNLLLDFINILNEIFFNVARSEVNQLYEYMRPLHVFGCSIEYGQPRPRSQSDGRSFIEIFIHAFRHMK